MAKLLRGAAVPLFERLSLEEASVTPTQFDPAQLQASIGRELARLLNTRSGLSFAGYQASEGTVLDYGVPDFTSLSPKSEGDMKMLEATLVAAVGRYEKRLQRVSARIALDSNKSGTAVVSLSGEITVGLEVRRVDFEMPLAELQAGHVKAQVL